jgi:hypothetical protein
MLSKGNNTAKKNISFDLELIPSPGLRSYGFN